MSALGAGASGRVRLSVGSAYAKYRLVPGLPAFASRCPKVSVEIAVTDRVVDLRTEEVDVAIRPGPVDGAAAAGLPVTPLAPARRHLCASPAYLARCGTPNAPEDLVGHNCLLMSVVALSSWPFALGGERRDVDVSGDVAADNADVLLDLALAGHGIVRLLDTIVGRSLSVGDLVPIMEDAHLADEVPVSALVRSGCERVPRIAALLDHVGRIDTGGSVCVPDDQRGGA